MDPSNSRAYAFRGLSRQALKQHEPALLDFAHAVRLDPRYAAAYCNQRAALHAARGDHELAAADYSLVLLFDSGNEVAKAGRDQALRALLSRPTPPPEEKPEPAPAPKPEEKPQSVVEIQLAEPQPAPAEKPRAAPKPARPSAKIRPKGRPAAKTQTIPAAAVAAAVAAATATAPEPAANTSPAESVPEFELGRGSPDSSVELTLDDPAAEHEAASQDGPLDELLLAEPDTEEERARQERIKEERRAEEARAEQEARVARLAAERQRMLEEAKRKKAEIDRSRRMKKRGKARDPEENDRTPLSQWVVRAALAAAVIWGGFWVYDQIRGDTLPSHPTCYPFHGSVKFADGRPVPGGVLLLQPVSGGVDNEADIGSDGTFQTKSFANDRFDGLPAGQYKAYLAVPPVLDSVVPPQYRAPDQTPWVVQVKRQDNSAELVIQ